MIKTAMKKIIPLILFIGSAAFLSGCEGPVTSKAALQINSTPKTTVFLDGQHLGQTPYYDEKLKAGEYTLKLVPETSNGNEVVSWEGKVKLNPDVLTVINRDLKVSDNASSGEILSLEPISVKDSGQIMVETTPDGASVKVDGQEKGITPLLLQSISAGDHEIVLSEVGYDDRIIHVRSTNGYKLIISAQLAVNNANQITNTTPTVNPTVSPSATASGKTVNKTISTPIPTSAQSTKPKVASVKILDTPTGWLRVRTEPSLSASEEAKVNTGDTLPFLGEESGWFKIEYEQGKDGWVSSQYAQKVNP